MHAHHKSYIDQISAGVIALLLLLLPQLTLAQATTTEETPVVSGTELERENLHLNPRGDFIVEPGKQEVSLAPGESVTKSIAVTNRTSEPISFAVTIEDLVGSDNPDSAVVLLGDERGPYSIQDYVSPAVKEFTLAPSERVRIPVVITIPKDAAPGGAYGAVIFSNAPSKLGGSVKSGAQTTLVSRLASILLIRVEGDVNESGHLADFRLAGPHRFFYQGGPLTFEILFQNDGNVHLTPYGSVKITNIFGQLVAELPVDAYFALPNSLRTRKIDWNKSGLLGHYTAHLTLNNSYGEGGQAVDEATLSFWVIPWKMISLAFAVVVLLIGLVYFVRSRFEFRRKE